MTAYDELRNELDEIGGSEVAAFNELVSKYGDIAEKIEALTLLKEELEREGHKIEWP